MSLILATGSWCLAASPLQGLPDELLQYVRDAKKAGLKPDQIQKDALSAGWARALVQQAMESTGVASEPPKSTAEEKPGTTEASRTAAETANPAAAEPKAVTSLTAVEKREAPGAASAPRTAPGAAPPNDSGAPKPATMDRTVRDGYVIGEGDVLQISVWGEPAASTNGVVRPDGMITIPLIKDVHVAGLSPAEVERVITEALSKQIKAADVTVIVSQINSKKIFVVGGGVKKEGPLNYTHPMTIMQALSEAGGLTDYAKRKKIYVLRNENGRQYKLSFDYDAVLNGEHMELNIPLLPNDTLVVPNH
jgi:polysaccharide export outer membrane protein